MTGNATAVVTRSNRGQWEIDVPGRPELSSSFSSREEAIDAGRTVADELGVDHVVEDAEPTGTIIDGGAGDMDAAVITDTESTEDTDTEGTER
jgi:hypothetical protein